MLPEISDADTSTDTGSDEENTDDNGNGDNNPVTFENTQSDGDNTSDTEGEGEADDTTAATVTVIRPEEGSNIYSLHISGLDRDATLVYVLAKEEIETGAEMTDDELAKRPTVAISGGNGIAIRGATAGTTIAVYTTTGQRIASTHADAEGRSTIRLPHRGIYIITIGRHTFKTVL